MGQLIQRADSDGLKVICDLGLIHQLVLVVTKRRVCIVLELRCRIKGVLQQRLSLVFCQGGIRLCTMQVAALPLP